MTPDDNGAAFQLEQADPPEVCFTPDETWVMCVVAFVGGVVLGAALAMGFSL
jgi:hypothetical protein